MKKFSQSGVIAQLAAVALGLATIPACQESDFSGNGKRAAVANKEADAVPLPDPVPEEETQKPTPPPVKPIEEPGLFQDCEGSENKFVADLYQLPVDTQRLPDFTAMSRIKETCLRQLDIAPRDFLEGFPGVDNLVEWFGLDIRFVVDIPEAGDYNFRVKSDDGSILFIDGQQLIDNDGLHEPISKEGSIFLTEGPHTFNVKYYQGPRTAIALELFWKTPGSAVETYLPLELVSRP